MLEEDPEVRLLLESARQGSETATAELFSRYADRLKRLLRLRLSRDLQGRVDEDDVLQEAYLEASRRLGEYLREPPVPFFLWLRQITSDRMIDLHRRHLGAQKRDANREVALHRGSMPAANSASIAIQLEGHLTTPSQAFAREEVRDTIQQALDDLPELDREVLALRHFEQLTTVEAAHILGITPSNASTRYWRALERMRSILSVGPEA